MEYYNKVIESVQVRFLKGSNYKIEKPITVLNYQENENALILLHHGSLKFGEEQELVNEGEVIFLPKDRKTSLTFGAKSTKQEVGMEQFAETKKKHLQSISYKDIKSSEEDCISILQFESKVFDVVNFFNSLDIPPFIIRFNDRIATLVEDVMKELETTGVGKERSLKAMTEVLVIELLRHILKNRLFTEELSTNSTYFKDPRLNRQRLRRLCRPILQDAHGHQSTRLYRVPAPRGCSRPAPHH
jgi:hypothetical protein